MKLLTLIGASVLALSLTGAVYAQEQHNDEKDKPAQEEKKAQPEKPAAAKQEEKNAQPKKNTKPEETKAPEHAQAKPANQHAAAGRIPADRYKANFGRAHTFRVSQGDYQNHRFQYGGYWFGFGSPWPSNWLYTQDVYVVEIGGVYYLCNPAYPGVNVTLNVTL
jgi:hypothetical protein